MSNKNLLGLIHKYAQEYAQDLGPPPGGSTQKPVTSPGAATIQNPKIREMQLAMQALAKTISSTIDYDSLFKSMSQPEGMDRKQFQKSFGRDAFTNFMVNSYMNTSKFKGVEFDPDPKKNKMSQKAPSGLKDAFIILDTLRRIGPGSQEFDADGKWGPRTNNALLNIIAIADSTLRLGNDLGMQSESFNPAKLTEFQNLVPPKDIDISVQEKIQRAPQVTKILRDVQDLYTDFKKEVLTQPNYAQIINGDRPVFEEGVSKVDAQGGEKVILQDLQTSGNRSQYVAGPDYKFTVKIPPQWVQSLGIKNPTLTLTGADLVSKDAFEQWANNQDGIGQLIQNHPVNWPGLATIILQEVQRSTQDKQEIPVTRK